MVHEIENFYGVYLLVNLNPKYKGRTYVGFTVNPNRRIQQHNKGKQAGGAWRTHGKGPWEMVLIIHGFPNMISALRFEWAWTNPKMSRRLRHIPAKRNSEKKYDFCIRVLCHMLSTGPWNRLPLTIRWLKQEYQKDLGAILDPPYHMSIQYGPVKSVKAKPLEETSGSLYNGGDLCRICSTMTDPRTPEECIFCLACKTPFHTICLAREFLKSSSDNKQLLPIEGSCPTCQLVLLWGDLIRYKRGCYRNDVDDQDQVEDPFSDWSKGIEDST